MIRSFEIRTRRRSELVDVTAQVREAIAAAHIDEGTVLVYVPHTTAAVTINENADPDVARDLEAALDALVPPVPFRHAEGNSDAHLKSSLVGCQLLIPVQGGRPLLGTWQGVWLCEFDGPRTRTLHVQVRGA